MERKLRKYLIIGSGVIIAVITITLFTLGPGVFSQDQESSNEIQIYAKITGLEEGDHVDIIGGRIPENPPEGEYSLKDAFKITVKKNGITLLPINKEGKWEIEAAAVNYGEIPEFHTITVEEGDNKTLEWELRKSSGIGMLVVQSEPSGCTFKIEVTPETKKDILVENEIEASFPDNTPWEGYLPVGIYKVIWEEIGGYEKPYPELVEIKKNETTTVVGEYTKISENKR